MKIYFAGPLFTPYVRDFISHHAQILRDHEIDPFVPHESFNPRITPLVQKVMLEKGLLTRDELQSASAPALVSECMRQGQVTRDELGLPPMTPIGVFERDMEGVSSANAVLALLDGTQVDDGTACEIGIFYGLSRNDPTKKGVAALMTDFRGVRRAQQGWGINLFVLGAIEENGKIFDNFDDALRQLKAWDKELRAESRHPLGEADTHGAS
jgi:nucleoside 2-deoxyribosyltransferase